MAYSIGVQNNIMGIVITQTQATGGYKRTVIKRKSKPHGNHSDKLLQKDELHNNP